MKRTVLVIDDLQWYIDNHVKVLEGLGLTIVTALTLEDAVTKYAQHRDELCAIILDGCVPGDSLNTLPFIYRVSQDRTDGSFSGILMAASSLPEYRHQMVRAGCTHEEEKKFAALRVLDLLTSSV